MLIFGIIFILLGTPIFGKFVLENIENGTIQTTTSDYDSMMLVWTISFISGGVALIICAIFSLLSGIFALKARTFKTKGRYITSLVFGVLINEVVLVGSIFGLISLKDEPKDEIIDVTK